MTNRKQFETLRARAALIGWQLWRTVEDEVACETFFARRNHQVIQFATIGDCETFLEDMQLAQP